MNYPDPWPVRLTARVTIMSKNILIIEDNADIAHLVSVNLRGSHMQVDHYVNGIEGQQNALIGGYHLVIIDQNLPAKDVMHVFREMRNQKNYTPILMLT